MENYSNCKPYMKYMKNNLTGIVCKLLFSADISEPLSVVSWYHCHECERDPKPILSIRKHVNLRHLGIFLKAIPFTVFLRLCIYIFCRCIFCSWASFRRRLCNMDDFFQGRVLIEPSIWAIQITVFGEPNLWPLLVLFGLRHFTAL